jgi:16S rRNA (uracil1498-N3)-methyltransferase
MRTPRVFVEIPLGGENPVRLPRGASRHLIQVLRLRAGAPVILFNGDGCDVPGRLIVASRDAAEVAVDQPSDTEAPAVLAVHLGIGVSRGERMDVVMQKAVELGVSRISPLFSRRSMVRLAGARLEKRQRHWRSVLVAACEQSGRRRLPELSAATALDRWLSLPHPSPLLLDHRSTTPLTALPSPAGAMTLLAGPEGGLAPEERARAMERGFTPVRLGPRVLRTETAPLAALAAIQALWGDFRG